MDKIRLNPKFNPKGEQKQKFDEEMRILEEQLEGELTKTGLEPEISRNILREITKQRVRIAVKELTDIAYLAENSGRKEYTIYDRSSNSGGIGMTHKYPQGSTVNLNI
ncbi:hypothetical protein HYS11_01005 [Candidatus Gottesmanbacteria bacterium]|nr:hypothetical protein [Candidatus Gottesmanbacteria bacterium]